MGQVKITVEKGSWNVKVEGLGFKGTSCRAPIEKILQELDARTLSRVPKDEETVKEKLYI